MWLGISNSNSKQGQGQGAASAAVVAMVGLCTISMSMLPLAASTIHHEGGAQGGAGGGNPNPANSLVALVNADRAAAKLPALRTTKGLGCMALQCISRCLTLSPATTCAADGTLSPPCHPPETDITEVYAANCGVELPTVDVVSGRILGCSQSLDGDALHMANATVVRGREHAQVGAGVDRGGFWCLLFSSGSPNSSFLLEAGGRGIAQQHGCFSDPDVTLSCTTSAGHHDQTRRLTAGFFALAASTLLLLLL